MLVLYTLIMLVVAFLLALANTPQLVWLLVAVGALVGVLMFIIVPRIFAAYAERQKRRRGQPSVLHIAAAISFDDRPRRRAKRDRAVRGRLDGVDGLSTIRDSAKILVINAGEIVEQGTHDELMATQGFYHSLFMSQFKGKAPGGVESCSIEFKAS